MHSNLQLAVIRNTNDFDSLKDKWNQLLEAIPQHTIFQTWLWQSLWWKHFGSGAELYVITACKDDGNLIGIAPLCLYQDARSLSTVAFIGGDDVTDYKDFIVLPGWEQDFFTALASYLTEHSHDEWQQLYLSCVPGSSPTLNAISSVFDGCETEIRRSEVCPVIDLPASWQGYLQRLDKKNRHELKRKLNKFTREARGAMVIAEERQSMQEAIASFVRVHKLSRIDKSLFMDQQKTAFFSDIAKVFFDSHMLELPLLYINQAVAASLFCFIYKDTVYIYNSGFDPAYSKWSPGIVLIFLYIQKCIENGRNRVDFLRGNEAYKYSFGVLEKPLFKIQVWKQD
ncbi:MAG TPA: GNAT family N-acetyltransferase [Thermodesulfovibrionia bacterium]|nr:GNAT family N-acetyltransferase [Thermodesulfovibrionia bacterium]